MKKNLQLLFGTAIFFSVVSLHAQTTKLANNSNIQTGIAIGKKAILVDDKDSLWVTTGTPAGTKKYTNKVALDTTMSVAFYSGKLYFAGVSAGKGSELWVTNGTAAGTKLVKDIYANANSSAPTGFFVFNNTMYFFATTSNGKELWKSDGTKAGTVLVKDINPGAGSSYTTSTYFFANNNILYFIANDGTHGAELWKTNGTSAGTVLVKDINPNAASSNAIGFTALGTQVLFSANDGVNGAELWKTNGTTAGTQLVKDIENTVPGFGSSPSQFFEFNGKLYFVAFQFTTTGGELWVTNGTTAGTTLVKDINPNTNSSVPLLANAIIIGNKFYFSATTNATGTELWGSNGTGGGTSLVKDINPNAANSNPLIWLNFLGGGTSGGPHHSLFNGKIFLQANDGTNGNELWTTDGTAANTKMVKNIRSGSASSLSSTFNYFYTSTNLYFSANDGSNGEELWQSDGTSAGTKIVQNINPGNAGSSPMFLYILLKNRLLFTANDGDNGAGKTDLYKLNASLDTLSFAHEDAIAAIAPDGRSFYIYPNPAKDKISVVVNNTSEKQAAIAITDQGGRQLYRRQLNNVIGKYKYDIDIHSYPGGVYYLQMITDKGIKTAKFIKD
ncbi:MAG TPA: ELWxxDGT repeat protein [Parafilimonas sp.]|nr:ELWxxDGT repeat protein [Parafilimonas sp.]